MASPVRKSTSFFTQFCGIRHWVQIVTVFSDYPFFYSVLLGACEKISSRLRVVVIAWPGTLHLSTVEPVGTFRPATLKAQGTHGARTRHILACKQCTYHTHRHLSRRTYIRHVVITGLATHEFANSGVAILGHPNSCRSFRDFSRTFGN